MSHHHQAGQSVVLLVEDNPDDALLTRRAFTKSRLANELVVVTDGVEALDYLLGPAGGGPDGGRGRPQPVPHLILLDLKLPRIDGLEVLAALRSNERTRRVPVVVLTSSDEESDLVRSYQLGSNSYIRKPVEFERFSEVIRDIGLYWLVLNLAPPVEKEGE